MKLTSGVPLKIPIITAPFNRGKKGPQKKSRFISLNPEVFNSIDVPHTDFLYILKNDFAYLRK